jgi:hypoxanthine phosphoribosyltransferase
MRPKSYNYTQRKGVRPLSWDWFAAACDSLVESLAFEPIDAVIGIARGGLFPATVVASSLRCEMFPIRVSRRVGDLIVYNDPIWRVDLPEELNGKTIAVVDDIADTGATLTVVSQRASEMGVKQAIRAVLISHSWASPLPEHTHLITDELVVFPWDRKVFENGEWRVNPEIVKALKDQDFSEGDFDLLNTSREPTE